MPVSRKPKRAYKARPVARAFNTKDGVRAELPIQIVQTALGTDWFNTHHFVELVVHAQMVMDAAGGNRVVKSVAHHLLVLADLIGQRHDRTGVWGVTGDEKAQLHEALSLTIPWVMAQKNSKLLTALKGRMK